MDRRMYGLINKEMDDKWMYGWMDSDKERNGWMIKG